MSRFETYDCSLGCPVEATLELIGGKWKGIVLFHLLDGPKRFGELQRAAGTVTKRVLTKQLRELEEHDLVNRVVQPTSPVRVDYSLTKKGQSLEPILIGMRDWGLEQVLSAQA